MADLELLRMTPGEFDAYYAQAVEIFAAEPEKSGCNPAAAGLHRSLTARISRWDSKKALKTGGRLQAAPGFCPFYSSGLPRTGLRVKSGVILLASRMSPSASTYFSALWTAKLLASMGMSSSSMRRMLQI